MKKFLPISKKFTLSEQSESKGFTLVELLVVITIIAILSTIGITVYSGTQASARDGKRRSDVDAISNALEAHYKDPNCGASATDLYCLSTNANFPGMFAGNALPSEPGSQPSYSIKYPSGSPTPYRTSYTVCASLENKQSGNAIDSGDGVTFNTPAPSPSSVPFYCKKSQQ